MQLCFRVAGLSWVVSPGHKRYQGIALSEVGAASAAVGHEALLAANGELMLCAGGWFVLVLRLLMLWPHGLIQPDCSNQYPLYSTAHLCVFPIRICARQQAGLPAPAWPAPVLCTYGLREYLSVVHWGCGEVWQDLFRDDRLYAAYVLMCSVSLAVHLKRCGFSEGASQARVQDQHVFARSRGHCVSVGRRARLCPPLPAKGCQ